MDRSTLRLLALQYANDDLDVLEYLRARTQLLDDLAAGRVEIERSPTPRPEGPPPKASVETTTSGELALGEPAPAPGTCAGASSAPRATRTRERRGAKTTPARRRWYVGIGTGAAIVALAWGALHLRAPSTTNEAVRSGTERAAAPALPEKAVTRIATRARARGPHSEAMIETLLMTPSWTRLHLQQFEAEWVTLGQTRQDEIRQSNAFRRLRERLARTIETQRAITTIDGDALARGEWARLSLFATALGIEASFPLPTENRAAGDNPHGSRSTVASVVSASAHASLPANPTQGQTARADWFANQTQSHFTVQLLTASRPEGARRLVRRFPDLDLKIQRSSSTPYLYRVVHGSFPTSNAADEASEALPANIVGLTGTPYVRRFANLKGIQIHE